MPDSPSGRPVLRLTAVRAGRVDLKEKKLGSLSLAEAERFAVRTGDFFVVRGNGSKSLVGQGGLVGEVSEEVAFPDTLIRVRPDERCIDARYLAALWGSLDVRRQIERAARTTAGIYKVNQQDLGRVQVAVAPLGEQRRIVDEVEKQFTRLDAAVAGLQRVKANLKRYRASVLKAACEGRLVPTEAELARREGRSFESGEELLKRILKERRARWEADQLAKFKAAGKVTPAEGWKSKYLEPTGPLRRSTSALPTGWGLASLDELSDKLTSGSRDWSQFYGRGQGTFVLAQNIRPGRLDMSFRQAVDAPTSDPSTERSRIRVGDLLLTIVGANTGDVCGVRQDVRDHFVCQSVALVRPVLVETSQFVEWSLVSQEHGQKQFRAFTYGQGRPHLGFEQIAATLIALPPLPEQHRIVAEVERRLSVVDDLEATVEKNLARCVRLRQSILQMAFEGRLVPQDPNDEPASVLLERIRKHRGIEQPRRRTISRAPRP